MASSAGFLSVTLPVMCMAPPRVAFLTVTSSVSLPALPEASTAVTSSFIRSLAVSMNTPLPMWRRVSVMGLADTLSSQWVPRTGAPRGVALVEIVGLGAFGVEGLSRGPLAGARGHGAGRGFQGAAQRPGLQCVR